MEELCQSIKLPLMIILWAKVVRIIFNGLFKAYVNAGKE